MGYDFHYHGPDAKDREPEKPKSKEGEGECKGCGRVKPLPYGGTLCKDCLRMS